MTTLFLGFWTGNTIPGFTQGSYMGVYAALGSNVFILYLLTYALINFIHCRGGYGHIKLRCHLRLRVRSRKFEVETVVILTHVPSSSIGFIASLNLFKAALSGVFGSPVSFFDTTPMGIKIALLPFNNELINFPQAESYRGCRKTRTLSIKSCR